MNSYERANTDWFADCKVGISVHWTAQTIPRQGEACEFADAVDLFRLDEFLGAVEKSGADYVIFTATHALQMLPCPHPMLDSILPGRTSERDLIEEIAQGLAKLGKKLIIYYNHSCNQGDDPAWEQAVGYHDQPKDRLAKNICGIVSWMGEKYGDLISAWWFDSSYSLDNRDNRNAVTTDMRGFQFPWEDLTVAAKAGYPNRLVTYNAGIARTCLYTDHQDYWSGELINLDTPPCGRYLDNGLQWHGWTCLEDRSWVYNDNSLPVKLPSYSDDELLEFLAVCRKHQAPMTFNVISFQDGSLAEKSVSQLNRITNIIKTER
jgi:alpha-L-fucosidase-like protein